MLQCPETGASIVLLIGSTTLANLYFRFGQVPFAARLSPGCLLEDCAQAFDRVGA